jgi:hypothetical protein
MYLKVKKDNKFWQSFYILAICWKLLSEYGNLKKKKICCQVGRFIK